MRLLATQAGLGPAPHPSPATDTERRGWLKRLGAALGLGLLAGKAGAAPSGTRQVMGTNDYLGEIMLFAGNYTVQNYMPCDGRLLSISQNTALFSLLGTTYGGNGQTNFGLPDLRNRVPKGVGSYVGETGGQETVTLTSSQLPAHTHALNVSSTATSSIPNGNYPAVATGTLPSSEENVTVNAYGPTANGQAHPAAISPAGGSQPVSVLDPYLVLNYQICVSGVYPPRY